MTRRTYNYRDATYLPRLNDFKHPEHLAKRGPVWRSDAPKLGALRTDTRANFDTTRPRERESDRDRNARPYYERGIGCAGSTDRSNWNLIIRVAAGCDYRVSPINQTSPVAPLIHPVIPRVAFPSILMRPVLVYCASSRSGRSSRIDQSCV